MKDLVIFANYKEAQTMTLIMLLVFGVIIETIRYLLVKKVNLLGLILNIAIFHFFKTLKCILTQYFWQHNFTPFTLLPQSYA